MIGNNRHSDRTFVSEHICIRLTLFAVRVCSSSPSLSPSLFLFPFLLSLSATPVLSFTRSSRLALPYLVSAFTVLRSLSNHTSVCFSFRNFPLALSRNTSSLLYDIVLRRTSGWPVSDYVHPLVLSLCSLFIPPFHSASLFPRAGPCSFFIPLPGWPIVSSLSLPGGFSFADVYISRQVGMQERTSYDEHVCVYTCKDSRASTRT